MNELSKLIDWVKARHLVMNIVPMLSSWLVIYSVARHRGDVAAALDSALVLMRAPGVSHVAVVARWLATAPAARCGATVLPWSVGTLAALGGYPRRPTGAGIGTRWAWVLALPMVWLDRGSSMARVAVAWVVVYGVAGGCRWADRRELQGWQSARAWSSVSAAAAGSVVEALAVPLLPAVRLAAAVLDTVCPVMPAWRVLTPADAVDRDPQADLAKLARRYAIPDPDARTQTLGRMRGEN